MLLKDFKPSQALDEWIKCFRIVHFHFTDNNSPPPKPYTPRPEQCLAFYPLDTEKVSYTDKVATIQNIRVALIGQHTQLNMREVGREFLVIQAIFKPGALYKLLKLPMSDLINQYIDASQFFGNDIHYINEQLFFAKSYNQMTDILNIYFLEKVRQNKVLPSRVEQSIQTLHQFPHTSLEHLAKQSYYSYKQFERHFYDRTGVTPRYYQRLVKFDHAFRLKNLPNPKSWEEIAWTCNYTDYQHLAKDYKEFTGMTPNKFHLLGSPEESLGLAESFYEVENGGR